VGDERKGTAIRPRDRFLGLQGTARRTVRAEESGRDPERPHAGGEPCLRADFFGTPRGVATPRSRRKRRDASRIGRDNFEIEKRLSRKLRAVHRNKIKEAASPFCHQGQTPLQHETVRLSGGGFGEGFYCALDAGTGVGEILKIHGGLDRDSGVEREKPRFGDGG
jgi:hypothetical protein